MFFERISFHFAEYALVKAFVESGISELLLLRPLSAQEIARAKGFDPRRVERFMAALGQIGVVQSLKGGYRIAPGLERYFQKDSPFYIGPYLQHAEALKSSWDSIAQALKGPPEKRRTPGFLPNLARALFPFNWSLACQLAGELGRRNSVLDVASGSCVWSAPFVLQGARGTAIDLPEVIEKAARPTLERLGILERYKLIPSNMFEADWGCGHDAVIIAHVMHSHPPPQVKDLFKMARDAVSKDGVVVAVEFALDVGAFPKLFDINMLVNTKEGKTYSTHELVELAEGAPLRHLGTRLLSPERGVAALIFSP